MALIGFLALDRDPDIIQGQMEVDEYRVSSKVPGRIVELRAKEGDIVHKGDILAIIDAPEVRAKKVQAESLVEQAEENLRLADESFKAGMCSSSDLMMAQTAWLQAQTELVDADIEIAMGKVYLGQALGN